jgi:putative transposase
LDAARKKHRFQLLGYVVMPDHVHLVLYLPDGMKLGLVVREIRSKAAREHFARTMGPIQGGATKAKRVFWNRRCYDHNCRTPETTLEKIKYCHMNPVKSGLVREPEEWAWSSYNWYEGVRDVPIRIDTIGEALP